MSVRVSDLERQSRELQRVNQLVDQVHVGLTGASVMDTSKPGQQAALAAAGVISSLQCDLVLFTGGDDLGY